MTVGTTTNNVSTYRKPSSTQKSKITSYLRRLFHAKPSCQIAPISDDPSVDKNELQEGEVYNPFEDENPSIASKTKSAQENSEVSIVGRSSFSRDSLTCFSNEDELNIHENVCRAKENIVPTPHSKDDEKNYYKKLENEYLNDFVSINNDIISDCISQIFSKISILNYKRKTAVDNILKHCHEITDLIQKLELLFESFIRKIFNVNIKNNYRYLFMAKLNEIFSLNEKILEVNIFLKDKYNFKLIDLSRIVYENDITQQNLQVKIQLQYTKDLCNQFEKNKIEPTNYANISFKLNKIICDFSQHGKDSTYHGINLIFRNVLYLNKTYFLAKGMPLNVTPLMHPEKIKIFRLQNKILEIVQSDVSYFYTEKIKNIWHTLRSKSNEEIIQEDKCMGADETAELSEEYINRVSEFFHITPDNYPIINSIFSNLIYLGIYGQCYNLYLLEPNAREQQIKEIFSTKSPLYIQKMSIKYDKKNSFETLSTGSGFLINFHDLLHKKFNSTLIDPFKSFNIIQLKSLKSFLFTLYGDDENWPASFKEYLYVVDGCDFYMFSSTKEITKENLQELKQKQILVKDRYHGYKLYQVDKKANAIPVRVKNTAEFEQMIDLAEVKQIKWNNTHNVIHIPGNEYFNFLRKNRSLEFTTPEKL